jgi:hypothetical protein
MYQADDFGVSGVVVETGAYHDVADAIRRGCKVRPKKLLGGFLEGETMACALGAAWVGGSGQHDGYSTVALAELFPELDTLVRFRLRGEQKEGALWQAIAELSDGTSYSREEIADWLCHQGGCKHKIAALRVLRRFNPRVPLELLRRQPEPRGRGTHAL